VRKKIIHLTESKKYMKVSKYLLLKLALLFFLFPTFLAAQAEQSKLSGPVIKGIVEQFVSMHYSQKTTGR